MLRNCRYVIVINVLRYLARGSAGALAGAVWGYCIGWIFALFTETHGANLPVLFAIFSAIHGTGIALKHKWIRWIEWYMSNGLADMGQSQPNFKHTRCDQTEDQEAEN
jgi:hypothetical protein